MSREMRCTYSFRFFDETGERHVVHEITEFHVQLSAGDVSVTAGESHLETMYGERVEQVEENEYCTTAGLHLWSIDPRQLAPALA